MAGHESPSACETRTAKRAKTTSTSATFDQQLAENGVLSPRYSQTPSNYKARKKQLLQKRQSPEPTEEEFKHYETQVGGGSNEASTSQHAVARLLNWRHLEVGFKWQSDRPFSELPPDLNFNKSLPKPQPDLVEGLETQNFKPFRVRKKFGGEAVFFSDSSSIALPHLVGELKSGKGSEYEATRQAAYDGAALVNGYEKALDHLAAYEGKRPWKKTRAVITSFCLLPTSLSIYSHHSSINDEGEEEYHQTLLAAQNMATFEGWKQGRMLLRNAQQYSQERTLELRDRLRATVPKK
ncbi:hypothetical protein TruAng_004302 [Truncatella angustata]|nr:hypothetical protein TruAng_004302 [Truncatella angustata]